MGQIRIQVVGSFPESCEIVETAEAGGHAAALSRAIRGLVDLFPQAIAKDHALHEAGEKPPAADFGYEGVPF